MRAALLTAVLILVVACSNSASPVKPDDNGSGELPPPYWTGLVTGLPHAPAHIIFNDSTISILPYIEDIPIDFEQRDYMTAFVATFDDPSGEPWILWGERLLLRRNYWGYFWWQRQSDYDTGVFPGIPCEFLAQPGDLPDTPSVPPGNYGAPPP